MATTHSLIQTATVATAINSFGFTAIPGTYTDLLVKLSMRLAGTGNIVDDTRFSFNGSTSNFSGRRLFTDGQSRYSDVIVRDFAQTPNNSTGLNIFGVAEFYITNYASSNYKVISADSMSDNNITSAVNSIWYGYLAAMQWSDTAAITSITFTNAGGGNFLANSTAYLYGISNA